MALHEIETLTSLRHGRSDGPRRGRVIALITRVTAPASPGRGGGERGRRRGGAATAAGARDVEVECHLLCQLLMVLYVDVVKYTATCHLNLQI